MTHFKPMQTRIEETMLACAAHGIDVAVNIDNGYGVLFVGPQLARVTFGDPDYEDGPDVTDYALWTAVETVNGPVDVYAAGPQKFALNLFNALLVLKMDAAIQG